MNYSNIEADLKNYKSGLENAKIGVRLLKKYEGEELPMVYSNIGIILTELKKPREALKYLDSAQMHISEFQNLRNRQLLHQSRYLAWKQLGNVDSAFANVEKLRLVDKLITQKETAEEMESLKTSFKKERELHRQVESSKIQIAKKEQRNLLLLILALLFALGAVLVYYFFKVKNAKAETKNAELEMNLLRSQINPHFIFNTLASIQSLIRQGKNEQSINYLNSFARFARTVLDSSRKSNVTLETELELVSKYAQLQRLRKDNFDFELIVSDELEKLKDEILFPAMSLQPFVENSIKHGFKNIDYRGKILISCQISNDRFQVKIEDNGSGMQENMESKQHHSHAIAIMKERLKSLDRELKSKSHMEIKNKTDENGVVVTLDLPIIPASQKFLQ